MAGRADHACEDSERRRCKTDCKDVRDEHRALHHHEWTEDEARSRNDSYSKVTQKSVGQCVHSDNSSGSNCSQRESHRPKQRLAQCHQRWKRRLLHQNKAVVANSARHPWAECVSVCGIGKRDIALAKHLSFEDVHGLVIIQREILEEQVSNGKRNAKGCCR